MADKKVDVLTGEVDIEETLEKIKDQEPQLYAADRGVILRVHCKPVFNYQSVEFDWDIRYGIEEQDLKLMEEFYSKMLDMLVRVSQNAPQKEVGKPSAPVEELASEKQKEILRNFHIEFKEPLTKKQAHALIKKSMDQDIF